MRRREFLGVLSGAAAWPLATHAQQTMPIIGWLSSRSAADSASALEHFQKGLAEAGYVEGRNVAVEYRWADGQFDRLRALAEDLVRRRVVVLVAVGGGQTPHAAQAATSTIPIVFGIGQDPVKAGLVANINRPGGNVTGATFFTALLGAKRLGLLRELVPGAEIVALIANQNSAQGQRQILDVREAAQQLGQRLVILKGGSDAELEASFASLVQQRAGALLMASDPFFDPRRERIVAWAAQSKVPTLYHFRDFPVAGGLMSYGASISDLYYQVGLYTGRVLNGDRPADLPIMLPSKFELVLNLKTARTLGLAVPPSVLALADEVIE
jgi:putative ABC transport system substrate-binding protein